MRRYLFVFILLFTLPAFHVQASTPVRLSMSDMYGPGMVLRPDITALKGKDVEISGFMAPPLKPDSSFFVLTKMPMAVCPFCDNEADWPEDIILVVLDKPFDVIRFNKRITARGQLDLGVAVDRETGFVSRIRILHAKYFQN